MQKVNKEFPYMAIPYDISRLATREVTRMYHIDY